MSTDYLYQLAHCMNEKSKHGISNTRVTVRIKVRARFSCLGCQTNSATIVNTDTIVIHPQPVGLYQLTHCINEKIKQGMSNTRINTFASLKATFSRPGRQTSRARTARTEAMAIHPQPVEFM